MLKRSGILGKGKGLKRGNAVLKKNIMKRKPKGEKQILAGGAERDLMRLFMQGLWKKLPKEKRCWGCGGKIYGDNLSVYWDHLLEKSIFPQFKYEERNMFFCCPGCHTKKTNGFPVEKHREAIEKAKKELLN